MNERFDELLAWYVNGTLGAEDRGWVERYAAEHPEARAQIDWCRGLQAQIRSSSPQIAPTLGLDRVLERIHGQRPTMFERMRGWLGAIAPGPVGALARPIGAAAALVIIVAQGGIIYRMRQDGSAQDEQLLRAMKATRVDQGPLLRVNFSPDAKEVDIRMLLVAVQATLAGGPGQLGDYYVRVPAGRESAAADRLRGQPIVRAVELVPGLPAGY
ncbi:MAG TPA: hypothetical protein VH183_10055 [Burkholderiaceae bacterium]|jgi:hypothetical protein|nr:hypothetical protein [Burkholderiaceae bacterium]